MKKILFGLIFVLTNTLLCAQVSFGEEENIKISFFAVRLVPTNNGVGLYYVIKINNNKITEATFLTKEEFIKQISGEMPSKANPTKENLFDKYKIKTEGWYRKTKTANLYRVTNVKSIDNLWKLRYASYPFHNLSGRIDTLGWTNNFSNPFMPTVEQLSVLKQFGLKHINDFLYGENLFCCLKKQKTPHG